MCGNYGSTRKINAQSIMLNHEVRKWMIASSGWCSLIEVQMVLTLLANRPIQHLKKHSSLPDLIQVPSSTVTVFVSQH